MVGGFLVSRAILSLTMFLFGLNALRGVPPRQWLRNKWWLLALGWVAMYGISYFWSDDKGSWDDHFQVKFPFLILPLAVSYLPVFSIKQIRIMIVGMALMLVASACYSMSFLAIDPAYYIYRYKYAHVLPTLPKRDHIRASLVMALFIVWAIYLWPLLKGTVAKWTVALSVAILIIFLHVLAAKSGLLSFYVFLICYGLYLAFTKKRAIGLLVIIAIPAFIFIALRTMPTFRERVNYMGFTYFMLKHGDKSGNYGDIGRLVSYKIGLQIIKEHPLTGVGGGDMLAEMNKYYDKNYPDIPATGRLVPHNQFLTVALACGIPAMLLFLVWVFMPLARLRRNREGFFLFVVWLLLFMQLMIEPLCEVQFGVFVFLFFLVLQMQLFTTAIRPVSGN